MIQNVQVSPTTFENVIVHLADIENDLCHSTSRLVIHDDFLLKAWNY